MSKKTKAVETEGADEAAAPVSNMVSLKTICDELGLKTTSARQKLRNKMNKPEGFRWEFTEAEAEQVREVLTAKPEPKAPAEGKKKRKAKAVESVPEADEEGSDDEGNDQ